MRKKGESAVEILYLDNKIVVCVKEPGVLSTDEPGGLPSLLRAVPEVGKNVYTVHRLDAAVGGVMVLARTHHAASSLGQSMQSGDFYKVYRAVTVGAPEKKTGTLRDFLRYDRAARRADVSTPDDPEAKEAILDYRVLAERDGLALWEIALRTGRTHQIRCQLASRSCPLWGDRKYGAGEEGGVALWSCALTFPHPVTGETLHFEKEPPCTVPWTMFFAGENE